MKKTYAGLFALTLTFSYLYINTALANLRVSVVASALVGCACVLAIFSAISEAQDMRRPETQLFSTTSLKLFLSLVVGSLITYGLSVYARLGSVVASGLVTLIGGILVPSLGPAITCGSFVGMTSPSLLGPFELLLAACIAGLVYLVAADVFNGFGGKLGTIAATGTTLTAILTGTSFIDAKPLEPSCLIPVVITCGISSAISFWINNRMKQGGVIASGVVALTGGLLLPAVIPTIGGTLAACCACGSYVGMSSLTRIHDEISAVSAGILAGLCYYWGITVIAGAGGRLGTTAFGSVLAISFLVQRTMRTKKN